MPKRVNFNVGYSVYRARLRFLTKKALYKSTVIVIIIIIIINLDVGPI